jgi:hypothetical protein
MSRLSLGRVPEEVVCILLLWITSGFVINIVTDMTACAKVIMVYFPGLLLVINAILALLDIYKHPTKEINTHKKLAVFNIPVATMPTVDGAPTQVSSETHTAIRPYAYNSGS